MAALLAKYEFIVFCMTEKPSAICDALLRSHKLDCPVQGVTLIHSSPFRQI